MLPMPILSSRRFWVRTRSPIFCRKMSKIPSPRIQSGAESAHINLSANSDAAVWARFFSRNVPTTNFAIKLIKRGMDTDFILKRFRNERQILATLDHPNIGRLFDGGTTDDGLPYFVMEYIEGEPIHTFCDSNKLTIRDRLQLFQKVCAAVQYAHQNLVIHRDLKPGNILVSKDGNPKLLDFGIAKVLDPELVADTLAPTATGMRLMTPEYASPEQIKGETLTPASDIYALGVLLYEISTGKRPYRFPSFAPHDIARVICEEEPEKPAQVLHGDNDAGKRSKDAPQTLETLSRNRQTTSEFLQRELSGDLQNIILKSLRKSPINRYSSAAEFSREIQAYLDGMPVSASSLHDTDERYEYSLVTNESLAVLPFRTFVIHKPVEDSDINLEDFLSLGLADSLITRLSNLKTITVRPTSSIVRYSADITIDPNDAGRELNVTYVLDGRIQQAGNRVRVTAQLVRVRNNETVWAGQFDEKSDDILTLQDSISAQVAHALVSRLTGEEIERIEKRGTQSVKAYESYQRGRYYWHSYTVDGLAKALVCFYEAIAEDPNFALAYTGVADYYNFLSLFGIMSPEECFPAAKDAAQRAIELDPDSAEAYTSLGIVKFGYDWDYKESERLFKRALEINPNYVSAHTWYAQLLGLQGKHEESLRQMRRAEKLSPQSPSLFVSHALTLRDARKFEKSLDKIRQALAIQPDYYVALQGFCWNVKWLKNFDEAEKACLRGVEKTRRMSLALYAYAYTLAAAGKKSEAFEIVKELEERKKTQYVPPIYFVLIYTELGDLDKAFKWLDCCFTERDFWYIWIPVDPRFEPLKQDARFEAFVQKIQPLTETDEIHQSHIETKILAAHKRETGKIEIQPTAELKSSDKKPKRFKTAAVAGGVFLGFILLCAVVALMAYRNGGLKINISNKTETNVNQPEVSLNQKLKAIAILPFKTDSSVENEATLGVGLAESLYKKLGQVKELSVRPAMLNLSQEQTPQELGRSFGVAYILRGTLHRENDKVQVAAELVETNNGKLLWAESFDQDIDDFQDLQVQISERVLNALTVQLTTNESLRIKKRYTENSEAYQLYLLGRYQISARTADSINKAVQTFTKARDLDPNFALAYVGLADAYTLLNLYQKSSPVTYAKAKENALKALSIDENLAEANTSLGFVKFFGEHDVVEAEKSYRRAIELNPSYENVHHWLSLALAAQGKYDEALNEINIAKQLAPKSATIVTASGIIYFYKRDFGKSAEEARNALKLDEGSVSALGLLRWVSILEGKFDDAFTFQQQEKLYQNSAESPVSLISLAQVQAAAGEREAAAASLKKAFAHKDFAQTADSNAFDIAMTYVFLGENNQSFEWLDKASKTFRANFFSVDPRLDKLHSDSRFAQLVSRH
jgi:eukaryotic-like serine/threonine-protein kinase